MANRIGLTTSADAQVCLSGDKVGISFSPPGQRVAVMHHVVAGLAMAPQFGAMYGSEAVSEQGLAITLIDQLPPLSVLIGDRNFGIFAVAWRAHRRGHAVLVRLTEACLQGRLIVARTEAAETLYLFTSLNEPAADVVSLYKERWNIETDLRSLKEQVRLHTISARSPDLVASELFVAVASYNLIRAVMAEAAQAINIDPGRLSFSRSREAFWAFARAVAYVESQEKFAYHWRLLLRSLSQSKLPKRHRPPAPRAVWPKPQNFPTHKVQKP